MTNASRICSSCPQGNNVFLDDFLGELPIQKRKRDVSFYKGTLPTFNCNQECIQSGSTVGLPSESIVYTLNSGKEIQKEGQLDINQNIEIPRYCNIGIAQTRGKRNYMEDTALVSNHEDITIIGVFDGHNGKDAAEFASENFTEFMMNDEIEIRGQVKVAIENLHKNICEVTDSGSTATLCLIRNRRLTIAHVGDSSLYIAKANVKRITTRHSASNEEEKNRIMDCGGCITNLNGVKRVDGRITVTRSIGDKDLHPPLTCEPELIEMDGNGVSYIIITSDGADNVTEDEMNKILLKSPAPAIAAAAIRNEAYKKGSEDNITVIVIELIKPISNTRDRRARPILINRNICIAESVK